MVASGLPTVYERHAQEMSLLALDLLDAVKNHVIPHLPEKKIQLRIGLHSGLSDYCILKHPSIEWPKVNQVKRKNTSGHA